MERQRVLIDGWPALMSLDLASRYLSIDDATFRRIAATHRVSPVELDVESPLWRKTDLDRLIRHLSTGRTFEEPRSAIDQVREDDVVIEKLAAAIAKRIERPGTSSVVPTVVSIKDAARMLGLGRSTIYGLINDGVLEVRRIGSRTLIPTAAIDALLANK